MFFDCLLNWMLSLSLSLIIALTLFLNGCFYFVSTTAVVDKPVGNSSHFPMVIANRFWAYGQFRLVFSILLLVHGNEPV